MRRILGIGVGGLVLLTGVLTPPIHGNDTTISGVVAGSYFTPPASGTPASTVASYYQGAVVCVDTNNNSVCDAGEPATVTDASGGFTLLASDPAALVAEVSTSAFNGGQTVTQRVVFRAAADQVTAAPTAVALTPLTTEIVRLMEEGTLDYATAQGRLATRLGVAASDVVSDPNTVALPAVQKTLLTESVVLTNRFGLAAKMVDRGDVSPAALLLDPNATGPAINMLEAQQAVMNLEAIPRYDHIFVIVLENRPTTQIRFSPYAPNINN